jgi:Membrane-fusion protein
MNKTPFALIFGSALLAFSACGTKSKTGAESQDSASEKTPIVKVEQVHAQDVDITNTYTSNIEPNVTNNIVSQSSGRIKNIYVEVGDKVKKGQLLAEMDAINLMKTKLQLKNDSIELDRLTELKKVGGVAQADYDLAKLSYELSKKLMTIYWKTPS